MIDLVGALKILSSELSLLLKPDLVIVVVIYWSRQRRTRIIDQFGIIEQVIASLDSTLLSLEPSVGAVDNYQRYCCWRSRRQ